MAKKKTPKILLAPVPKSRKVIQIQTSVVDTNNVADSGIWVYALCDDGSIWYQAPQMDGWVMENAIPRQEASY